MKKIISKARISRNKGYDSKTLKNRKKRGVRFYTLSKFWRGRQVFFHCSEFL